MEPKQVKKLVINQEIISNLDDTKMSKIKGGTLSFMGAASCQYPEMCLASIVIPCLSDTCPSDSCPQNTCSCVAANCPDTNILDGDCFSQDYEICRYSEYHC